MLVDFLYGTAVNVKMVERKSGDLNPDMLVSLAVAAWPAIISRAQYHCGTLP